VPLDQALPLNCAPWAALRRRYALERSDFRGPGGCRLARGSRPTDARVSGAAADWGEYGAGHGRTCGCERAVLAVCDGSGNGWAGFIWLSAARS